MTRTYDIHRVTNTDDVIDTRELIAAIDELTDDIETAELEDDTDPDPEDVAHLAALRAFADQCADSFPDYEYGEALVRDSYWVEYAQQLADDIGAINAELTWPLTCIDWEQAARELQMDYTAVEFDGVTYWGRS